MVTTHSEEEWRLLARSATRAAATTAARSSTAAWLQLPARRHPARRSGSASSRRSTRSSRAALPTWRRDTAELLARNRWRRLPCADDADHERSWFVYVVLLPDNERGSGLSRTSSGRASASTATCRRPPQPYMRERYGFREGLCPVSRDASSRSLRRRSSRRSSPTRRNGSRALRPRPLMEPTRSLRAEPFATKDGSTIRELHDTAVQSLAEATLEPARRRSGTTTPRARGSTSSSKAAAG